MTAVVEDKIDAWLQQWPTEQVALWDELTGAGWAYRT
jgi:hypothetical protein